MMLCHFKISFYMNSQDDKLSRKRKRVDYFITVGIVVQRDDGRKTAVKENNGGRWSSNGVMVWLGRRQNRDMVEWWGE
jgi:hypothetical protein